jgi:hypothetical protein
MRKMLFCCCEVHEAAGGPPAFCVMEARDDVDKSSFVYAMEQRRHVALGGLIVTAASVCKRLARCDPYPILTSHLLSCDASQLPTKVHPQFTLKFVCSSVQYGGISDFRRSFFC